MRNYFTLTIWGLIAFFAATFLFIFVLASTNEDEQIEEPPIEEPGEEENGDSSNGDSDEEENDDSSNGDSNEEENDDSSNGDSNEEENGESSNGEEGNNDEPSEEFYWGVDSATYTDKNMYACVIENFGEPAFWGRYLGDKDGVSFGMDNEEVSLLHGEDVAILVIYNHVNDVTGYDHGVDHAEAAIQMAEDLSVPEDVAIFLNVEPEYPVDSAFMEAWYDTLEDSNYSPAVYGVFDEGSHLDTAYNAMDEEIQENTIVWTAYPQEGITSQANAPEFNPQAPDSALHVGWQYGLDAETCNIDTNLIEGEMMEYLWQE